MKEAQSKEDIIKPITVTNIEESLHSLLDSISHVQVFKGKWSLISTKLTTLQTRLNDLSDFTAIDTKNILFPDLLRSLSATCSCAASLAALCDSLTPPGGKLKTQSDIDSVSAKIDSHINDLEVLVKSGIFSENAVVEVSSGKRESVRAETQNLMTRLQIGSIESKNTAMDFLLGLLQEDDKNVLIAVAQGIVPILVRLLDSSSSFEIREKSVAAIAKISTLDSNKHVLLAEGLILLNNLLRMLESGSVFSKEKSCIALKTLSTSKDNARAIASRGGISSLLDICIDGTPNSQALAAGVLRNLSVFEDIKENFVDENAVSTLLGLCNSGTVLAQENSISCLCNLVSGDDDLKLFVAREGGIESMKIIMDSSPTAQFLEIVVKMVSTLASCPFITQLLVTNGFLNRVVEVLDCGVLGVRIAAAKAVYDLSSNNRSRKELGEMGCINLLVRMLDGKNLEEKEAAARALSMLMNYDGNRRILKKDEKGVVCVVQLLDPLLQNLNKKYLILILTSLVQSKKCRKQMVAAGAVGYLQKLVEKDVDGAKKLLDSLGHGKLWGVFFRA